MYPKSKCCLACLIFLIGLSSFLSGITAKAVFAEKRPLTIGIISAVPAESGRLLELMDSPITKETGRRAYHKGKLYGIDTVLVASRIGKVAAAATVTQLILEYHVDFVVFTGVAGAIDPSVRVGDVVVATSLIQHDMDARPFCAVHEIPLLKITSCDPDPILTLFSTRASHAFIEKDFHDCIPRSIVEEFRLFTPKVLNGLIITGDQVISQQSQKARLRAELPEALCVEMEGASVGQVCYEYGVPFAVIRTVSDYAEHQNTVIDVKKFVSMASGYYSASILKNLYAHIRSANQATQM